MITHTSLLSHSLAFFPLLLKFFSISPLFLPCWLCVCVRTCRYHASDHGCYAFMITTPILNSGDSICFIGLSPGSYSLSTFLFPCSLSAQWGDSDAHLGLSTEQSLIRIWLVMISWFYICLPSLDDSVKYKCWLIYLSIHFLFNIRFRQMHIFRGD